MSVVEHDPDQFGVCGRLTSLKTSHRHVGLL